jgi:hypothetical protein
MPVYQVKVVVAGGYASQVMPLGISDVGCCCCYCNMVNVL